MLEYFSAGVTERWNVIVEKEILHRLPQRDERTPPQCPVHTHWVLPSALSFSSPGNCFPISLFSRARFCPVESVPPTLVWATLNTALLSPQEAHCLPPALDAQTTWPCPGPELMGGRCTGPRGALGWEPSPAFMGLDSGSRILFLHSGLVW